MNYTIYYRDLTKEYRAEKAGFSFWAFIFRWLWLAANGLWLRSLWGLTLYALSALFPLIKLVMTSFPAQISLENIDKILAFVLKNTAMVDPSDSKKSLVLMLLSMVYLGAFGRHWLRRKFKKADYSEVRKQNGLNKEDAIAQAKLEVHFSKHSDKIEDDWSVRKRLNTIKQNPLQEDTADPLLVVLILSFIAVVTVVI